MSDLCEQENTESITILRDIQALGQRELDAILQPQQRRLMERQKVPQVRKLQVFNKLLEVISSKRKTKLNLQHHQK